MWGLSQLEPWWALLHLIANKRFIHNFSGVASRAIGVGPENSITGSQIPSNLIEMQENRNPLSTCDRDSGVPLRNPGSRQRIPVLSEITVDFFKSFSRAPTA